MQGCVWLPVSPPFTWEAIMMPGMVDEMVRVAETTLFAASLRVVVVVDARHGSPQPSDHAPDHTCSKLSR
jgi:hypothetical protein